MEKMKFSHESPETLLVKCRIRENETKRLMHYEK